VFTTCELVLANEHHHADLSPRGMITSTRRREPTLFEVAARPTNVLGHGLSPTSSPSINLRAASRTAVVPPVEIALGFDTS
jgi:hypothetical protein